MVCDGNGDSNGDHCCTIGGKDCPHLVVDGPTGRRFACGLFTELGDWELVHTDPRYLADVRQEGTADCGDWWGPSRETTVALAGVETSHVQAQCCFARAN